ncbi:uncharacterized protein LOC142167952 [Nicotiana tabacum]|uniref:Uncharacterized protein LOC142167952 n=1 Tax=Nicotiana tabacum TaxID=4097 RepID=A0AC58SIA0_TOBAC
MAEDYELWDVICDGAFVPTKDLSDPAVAIPKMRKEFNDVDRKAIEKNFRAKKILVCGISPDEYNRISACQSAKVIWEDLQTAHEGTTQVKQSKIDMLTTEYELFRMKDDEHIQDMHTRFTSIINEIHSLGETISRNKLVRKILSVLPSSWESKVNAITKAKDIQTLTIDELVGNLKTSKRNLIPDKRCTRKNVADNVVNLINDKDALTLELGEAEQTRDDLVIVVVDLKETIENLKKDKDVLDENIANIEHERDDLMVVVVDLKETLEFERKEKEVSAERVAKIEHERDDLLVVVVDLKETIGEPKIERIVKGSSLQWYMDNGCSEHMTGSTTDFLSLKAQQGGIVSFGNGKKEYILGVGRIGKSLSHSIENVYYVNVLKYKLLCVSQICDKGNKVEFVSKVCTVTNIVTGDVVLVAKRYKKIYVADFESLQNSDLNCISAINDDAELWHRRLGHASFTLLKKLVRKDLVRGLPKSSFKNHKVCDACVKGKQVRSSFKPKREVSTSKSLDLLHMDLCGPMRVESKGGKKYIFVIVEDYSRFTWTLFLRTKDETFEVFVAFVKMIQVKMGNNVVCIRSDHGIEFDNAKFDEFCTENGITHNVLAPRTPQQNGVVERKNRTLKDMARTMLIDSGIAKYFWAEAINTACYLVNSKAYKVYNKRTLYAEESIHVIFDESHLSCEKDRRVDQDGEPLSVPGDVIDMSNGKAYMVSHVKESRKDDTNTSPSIREESSPMITITEAETRVADAVQGTPLAEVRSSQEPQSHIPESSTNEIQVPNFKDKSSHPLDNIIAPLDSGVQTRSIARNSLAF